MAPWGLNSAATTSPARQGLRGPTSIGGGFDDRREPHHLGRFTRGALAIRVPQADLPVLLLFRIPDGHLQIATGDALVDPDAGATSGTYGSLPAFTGGHMALLSLV